MHIVADIACTTSFIALARRCTYLLSHRSDRSAHIPKPAVGETRAGFETIFLAGDITTDATYATLHTVTTPTIPLGKRSSQTFQSIGAFTSYTCFTQLSYTVSITSVDGTITVIVYAILTDLNVGSDISLTA